MTDDYGNAMDAGEDRPLPKPAARPDPESGFGADVQPDAPDAPAATFAPGTPKRVIGWSTLIIVVAFGLTVLGVVAGALWLAGQDKALPGEIIALASMALTFMGKAIVDEVTP